MKDSLTTAYHFYLFNDVTVTEQIKFDTEDGYFLFYERISPTPEPMEPISKPIYKPQKAKKRKKCWIQIRSELLPNANHCTVLNDRLKRCVVQKVSLNCCND